AMLMTIINGFQPAASGFFTATGRVKKGMFITMTRQLIFLLPLLLILPLFFGIDGVVFAAPAADSISAVIAVYMILKEMKRMDGLIADQGLAVAEDT
ncbi:MAG: MATE family efflux transporter, partial [Clostridiales bacterium]|nr:MATE family efflux transporter [Clostridiales bacterium]